MDRLHFTQNDLIDIKTCSITAASDLRENLNPLRDKHLYFFYREYRGSFKIEYPNLPAFNDLRDLLESFVVKYPLTEIEQRP